jgi:ATP/maltotriose-dependent transcriptional regulator MalT
VKGRSPRSIKVKAARAARRPPADGGLAAASRALAQGRFDDARRGFEAALAGTRTPEALEGLGWATLWQDETAAAVGHFEDAHRQYLERDERRGAGRAALWLVYSHGYILGQRAIAGGWIERALRLLDGLSAGPEHVWLAVAIAATRGHDAAENCRALRDAAEIGRRLARPDLEALGLAGEGLVRVIEGEFAGGMRLLDEAAAAAIASGSDDFAAVAHTLCAMLVACEYACDFERASEWSGRTAEYARRHRFRPLHATCQTTHAGVLIWRGLWREAEAELLQADRELSVTRPASRAQTIVRLADLRRRQGRFSEAAQLFAQVEGDSAALPGMAALALDVGDAERARDLAQRYLRQTPASDRGKRASGLDPLVSAGARLGDLDAADQALEELESIAALAPSGPLRALASAAAGRIAATREEPERARQLFEDAIDMLGRCGAPFECAQARLDLAAVLHDSGRRAAAAQEARRALETFERLGAAHGVERATAFLDRLEDGSASRPPAGLTARELGVLRLLAAGLRNRDIAARLGISEHTVHRHLSNLYRKLDVSSRTAAAAFAHRHARG